METKKLDSYDQLDNDWHRILKINSTNTIFLTQWWQKTWYKHFIGQRTPLLLVVKKQTETVGIAPLMLEGKTIRFMGGTDLFDYQDFLIVPGYEKEVYFSIIEFLDSIEWDNIVLESVVENSPILSELPKVVKSFGYNYKSVQEDVTPGSILQNSWDQYIALLSKKHRHEIRRKLKRLSSTHEIKHMNFDSTDNLKQGMAMFVDLHKKSSPQKSEFMTEQRAGFFAEIVEEASQKSHLRLRFTFIEDKPVSSTLGFNYNDSFLLYNSGYDPEYSNLSVGIESTVNAIKVAIDEGLEYFDFLRGPERYKYQLGGKDKFIYQISIDKSD